VNVTSLRWGHSRLRLSLPTPAVELAPPTSVGPALDVDAVSRALAAAGLAEAAARAKRIVLVVNDQTRKAGVRTMIEAILPLLPSDPAQVDVALLIAYGLHAVQPDDVSRALYGDAALARARLVHHDGSDPSKLAHAGTLPSGAPLLLAKTLLEADLAVLVGGMGFHYHAGFSGGRKAVFPGVADRASIERNHLRVLDPTGPKGRAAGCGPARLDGNPVHEELLFGPRLAEARGVRFFLCNAIVDARGEIVDLAVGLDHERAFVEGSRRLTDRMSVRLGALPAFDAVIASAGGHPYDAALYQAHKAYDNAYRAVLPAIARGERPTVIFLARCHEGLGHPRFARWLEQPTRQAHYDALLAGYEIVGQTSLAVRDKAAETRTIAVTDLDEATCARLGWERAADLEEALAMAGPGLRYAVMPAAAQTLPLADG
jgi:nickel-dependent lactate racemase